MFTIATQSIGDNANHSSSDMSISSLSPLTPSRASSPALSYISQLPSPAACTIQFGTTERVEPVILRPLKLEDGEISAEDQPLLPVPAFTTESPAQVSIKIEQFETTHNAREAEAKQEADASTSNQNTNTPTIVPINKEKQSPAIPQTMNNFERLFRYKYFQRKFTDEDTFSERSSGWDSEQDEEYLTSWPNPVMTPPEGDDMHPPQWGICGQHPGEGWELNDILTRHYYRFLIPDPSTNRNIVAPYVSYLLKKENPQISATYGRGYPVHQRPLRPMPVDYICQALTATQMTILDPDALFSTAINNVINTYFPYDLSAGIRQYQYYRETQHAIQNSIKRLQEKEMRYTERALEVLSELENANVLGRILAHDNIIREELLAYHTTDPYAKYAYIVHTFDGDITQSGHDTRINVHHTRPERRESSKERNHREVNTHHQQIETILREAADNIEDKLRDRLHQRPLIVGNRAINPHARKRCFRCGHWGHLRTSCPRSYGPPGTRSRGSRK
jgi:hypothetical protein